MPGKWRHGNSFDSIVSDNPTDSKWVDGGNVESYGGYLVCESVSKEIARRIIACVDYCSDMSTEDIERHV